MPHPIEAAFATPRWVAAASPTSWPKAMIEWATQQGSIVALAVLGLAAYGGKAVFVEGEGRRCSLPLRGGGRLEWALPRRARSKDATKSRRQNIIIPLRHHLTS